ncbi:MAG: anaerobic ribonucleoside-triphosphate reductase activating protein [Oscillospiraceae bacterium]|nr:anaerobic ribonucleoside-triphosphate reductase activating protein [Oscillospiraceae bacterium]
MNYAEIKYYDIANGPGVRTSLFVSGCTHHCEGCFNEETWDFRYGRAFTRDVWDKIYKSCEPYYITGLTVLGGEPFEPENQIGLIEFMKGFKMRFPDKSIWMYSGYTYEQLKGQESSRCRTDITDELLDMTDVLVDGKFEISQKNITLRFRGSENQRLIDLKKTKKSGEIVIWNDDPVFDSHIM